MVSAAADAATPLVTARQKIFGIENVDANTGAVKKDRVIFSWLTNTSYAVSVLGRVIMLDSYVTRLELTPGRTPFVIQDLVDLKPEAILLGHGHFDHADNGAYIAKMTGATIYASPETCDAMQADIARMFADPNAINGGAKIIPDGNPVPCMPIVSRGSTPGTEITRLNFLEPLVCLIGFKHMHSNAVSPDPAYPPFVFNVTQDSRDAQMYPRGTTLTPPTNPASRVPGQINTATSGSGGPGGPIAMFYEFVLRTPNNFTFAWHNSTGALKEGLAPDGAWGPAIGQSVFNLFAAIPYVDLELGSASSANTANNGHRDIVMYQQYLQPKVFIPGHMTTGTNGVGESSTQELYFMYRNAQQNIATVQTVYMPEVRWLVDPTDYIRPMTFIPGDPRWSNPAKAARVSQYCGS
jgi:L-ascorbate metabolism protein UlaG (beta-lactamase superfamily)